jgi:ATP-binding cassette subfamily C protein LapB
MLSAMTTDELLDHAAHSRRVEPAIPHEDPLLDCLAELARIHGVPKTAQALAAGLPLVDRRLSAALLPRAAARARLTARWVRRPLADIPAGILPAILLLDGERACLLLEIRQGKYLISDPELGGGAIEVDAPSLAREYRGIACYVRPMFRFDARAPEPVRTGARHWFWSAIIQNRRLYRDAVLAALLINIFSLAMPLFTMNVYDRVVPNNAVETLWVLVTGIGIVVVFNMALVAARAYVVDSASQRVDVHLSSALMERVLDLRMENRPAAVGSFAANLRSFEAIRDFIASASITTLVDLPFIVLFLAVLAWISPWMLFPPLIAAIVAVLVSIAAQFRMGGLTMASYQACSQRNATLVEALTGLETVKILNAQGIMQGHWERATQYIAHINGKLRLISSTTVSLVGGLQQLVSIAVITIGVYLARDSSLSMGGIVAASMISGRCLVPLGQMASLLMQYQNARASLGSIGKYMQLPVERPQDTEFMNRPVFQGAIEFRDVTFAYPGAAQPAVQNVSFKIRPGEKVAVIGRIGSGKSTLQKLILGLYQPTQGTVLVDGIDIRQIDPAQLRGAIGHVPQDPLLFYGTLRQNIAMGAPHADDATILAAADVAGVSGFANVHPDGFDMVIGERGESLSGGQRQSVSIARALVNDPPILLLDELTSNIDGQTEALLRTRLAKASTHKTMLMVTHRTALLDLASRMIVLEGGSVVADGPKDTVVEAMRTGRLRMEPTR